MVLRGKGYVFDTGVKSWGGSLLEGCGRSSFLCPGHNTLASYLEKRLPAKARRAVEEHLASCRECRADVMELRQLIGHLNAEVMEEHHVY